VFGGLLDEACSAEALLDLLGCGGGGFAVAPGFDVAGHAVVLESFEHALDAFGVLGKGFDEATCYLCLVGAGVLSNGTGKGLNRIENSHVVYLVPNHMGSCGCMLCGTQDFYRSECRWFAMGREDARLERMSDQNKTAISTTEAPAAIGPYSQAVRVGDMLFTSGQVALDPATGVLVPGGITEQTVRVLENLKAVLGKAGLDMVHVVKTTVFLKSMSDFAGMNEVYARYLAPHGVVAPARSTVAVAGLPKDALVEIEVIAKESAEA